jgi:hypothetical protein
MTNPNPDHACQLCAGDAVHVQWFPVGAGWN